MENLELFIDNRQPIDIDQAIIDDIKKGIVETLRYEEEDLNKEISLSFVDNQEIHELNKEFRGVDRETDVLSFPLSDEFGLGIGEEILGDIVISVEKAGEQAEEYGHSLKRELVYLTVHSCLHLLGYDHMEEEEKKDMRSREKEIMRRLDILR